MENLDLVVEGDHLERVAKATALAAVSELIWNALDAEADEVDVVIHPSTLAGELGVGKIEVIDNGHGMAPEEVPDAFGHLGGSWKATSERSRNRKVLLHGHAGQGRFKALALGGVAEWDSVAAVGEERIRTHLSIHRASLKRCAVQDPEEVGDDVGTTVSLSDPTPLAQWLVDEDRTRARLTGIFALRIREQRGLEIRLNGAKLDPESLQANVAEYEMELENEEYGRASLTIVEWNQEVDRALHLCDLAGFSLHSIPPGIQAPTFNFTAYAHWNGFREHEQVLGLGEMSHDIAPVIVVAQDQLREHFRRRADERDSEVIKQWKDEGAYPYEDQESSSLTSAEQAERQVFDLVALTMNAASSAFAKSESSSKKVTLRLLQEAVELSPESIHRILGEVARLDTQRLNELAELLEHTELSKIITATRQVTDRLNFIDALDILLFDLSSEVGERDRLHPILEGELWIFGDHFDSAISEKGLTNVLREHIAILGRDELIQEPVRREDGTTARLDLMLSARVAGRGSRKAEHLVVELKSPSVILGMKEYGQIHEYATAVLGNPRFYNSETYWEFWLLGNEFDSSLTRLVEEQTDRQPGLAASGDNYSVWVLPWSRLIEDHRRRLLFMKEALEHHADEGAAIEYLRRTHARYLPASLAGEDATNTDT